jgi:hypothetical protein
VWTGLIGFRIGSSGGFCEHDNEYSGKVENVFLHRMGNYEIFSKELGHVVSNVDLQLGGRSVSQSVRDLVSQLVLICESHAWRQNFCFISPFRLVTQ